MHLRSRESTIKICVNKSTVTLLSLHSGCYNVRKCNSLPRHTDLTWYCASVFRRSSLFGSLNFCPGCSVSSSDTNQHMEDEMTATRQRCLQLPLLLSIWSVWSLQHCQWEQSSFESSKGFEQASWRIKRLPHLRSYTATEVIFSRFLTCSGL